MSDEGTIHAKFLRDKTIDEHYLYERALEAIVVATSDDAGHEFSPEPGDCAACDALRIAREALSSTGLGSTADTPPPPAGSTKPDSGH